MNLSYRGERIQRSVPIGPLTTLHIGPIASMLISCQSSNEIIDTIGELDQNPPGPILLLGAGSNVLIADDLQDLVVITLESNQLTFEDSRVRVHAGMVWDQFVERCVDAGLAGLECLSGIPGKISGAIIGNMGAYGVEVSRYLRRVSLFDRLNGQVRWHDAEELHFGYRTSILKGSSRWVVLEAEFELTPCEHSVPLHYRALTHMLGVEPGQVAPISAVRQAILAVRHSKGMLFDPHDRDTYSVGSFFTNPVVSIEHYQRIRDQYGSQDGVPHWNSGGKIKISAGWLIEQAGFPKGYPGEGAACRLSTKHALAITNRGTATSADVLTLARTIRESVEQTFQILLTPEPVLIGCSL